MSPRSWASTAKRDRPSSFPRWRPRASARSARATSSTSCAPRFEKITLASVRAFAPSGLDAGGGSGLEVIVTAPSFEDVATASDALADRLRESSDGVGERRAYEENTPGFDIRVNRDLAREIGIDARAISDALRTFFASAEVTEFISRDRQYPVILQAPEERRADQSDLRGLNVRTEAGELVPLGGLVTLERRASVQKLTRFNRQPSVEISGSPAEGVDLGAAIATVEPLAEEVLGEMQIAFGGKAESFRRPRAASR